MMYDHELRKRHGRPFESARLRLHVEIDIGIDVVGILFDSFDSLAEHSEVRVMDAAVLPEPTPKEES